MGGGAGGRRGARSGEGSRGRTETSWWEWLVAGVSAVLVLGVIGALLYEALARPETPPVIEVAVDSIAETGTGFVVTFTARNRGWTTAAGLVVEGELRSDTGTVETAQATITYVPAQAQRRGGLFFAEDPRRYALRIRPKGYDAP